MTHKPLNSGLGSQFHGRSIHPADERGRRAGPGGGGRTARGPGRQPLPRAGLSRRGSDRTQSGKSVGATGPGRGQHRPPAAAGHRQVAGPGHRALGPRWPLAIVGTSAGRARARTDLHVGGRYRSPSWPGAFTRRWASRVWSSWTRRCTMAGWLRCPAWVRNGYRRCGRRWRPDCSTTRRRAPRYTRRRRWTGRCRWSSCWNSISDIAGWRLRIGCRGSPRASFNPTGQAWLPVLHTVRGERHYTVLYSNTARAHELGATHDWVVIYRDDDQHSGRWTVITAGYGRLHGRRIVRGREDECQLYYDALGEAGQSPEVAETSPPAAPHVEDPRPDQEPPLPLFPDFDP